MMKNKRRLLSKMVLVKSFLTVVLYDHLRLMFMYLNDEEKLCDERYFDIDLALSWIFFCREFSK